jgi:parallel beta-helix repeat protein
MRSQWIQERLISAMVLLAFLWGGFTGLSTMQGEGKAVVSNGTIYYVAPTGNDSNPGTQDYPWRTIQKAADTLVAGETVYIRTGIYEEEVSPQNSGSADAYIVYATYPGDIVTIDGVSVALPEWNGLFNLVGQDYIRVSGLRVINAGPGPHNPGILVEDASHIIIEYNFVYNSSDSGIMVWNSDNVSVAHNEVEGACYDGYNESISIGRTDAFEVRYNQVHHSTKMGHPMARFSAITCMIRMLLGFM